DAVGGEIDARVLPHAAAQRFVGVAVLLIGGLLRRDVAVHVAAGGVLGVPHSLGILRGGVEGPFEVAGLGVERLDEAADAVFAAVGADEDHAFDGRRRHGLGIALLGIGDLLLPFHRAGFAVERDELGVERRHIDLVVIDGDAAVVGAAAIGRDRTHLVLVFPDFLAGLGVERVDVVEGGRDIHHAIGDDRRSLHRIHDVGLENPGDVQAPDVARIDLAGGIEAVLPVIGVGLQEVLAVLGGAVVHGLGNGGGRRRHRGPGSGAALHFFR